MFAHLWKLLWKQCLHICESCFELFYCFVYKGLEKLYFVNSRITLVSHSLSQKQTPAQWPLLIHRCRFQYFFAEQCGKTCFDSTHAGSDLWPNSSFISLAAKLFDIIWKVPISQDRVGVSSQASRQTSRQIHNPSKDTWKHNREFLSSISCSTGAQRHQWHSSRKRLVYKTIIKCSVAES